jgi:predicted nucleic acid-binding protein
MGMTDANRGAWFVDTNILIYAVDPTSPWNAGAMAGLASATQKGISLCVSPQVLREFLAVATRPKSNGDQPPLAPVMENLRRFMRAFRVLSEDEAVVAELLRLLDRIPARGKQIHDANIIATMVAHGVSTLLTHNRADFKRYAKMIEIVGLDRAT